MKRCSFCERDCCSFAKDHHVVKSLRTSDHYIYICFLNITFLVYSPFAVLLNLHFFGKISTRFWNVAVRIFSHKSHSGVRHLFSISVHSSGVHWGCGQGSVTGI